MRPPALLVLLALTAVTSGLPIVPRDSRRYRELDGPVWGDTGNELAGNNIRLDEGREETIVFEAPAAPAVPSSDREIEGILEQPVESLLDEGVVARLRALGEPRLEALLLAPARLLVARPAEVRQALARPVYLTLSARAAHLLEQLPYGVKVQLASLLRKPLRALLRRDPGLEPLLRSFINTPDLPATCPPGQRVAQDGTCRDKWK